MNLLPELKEVWQLMDDMGRHSIWLIPLGGECWKRETFHSDIYVGGEILGPVSKDFLVTYLLSCGYTKKT